MLHSLFILFWCYLSSSWFTVIKLRTEQRARDRTFPFYSSIDISSSHLLCDVANIAELHKLITSRINLALVSQRPLWHVTVTLQ